jgi:hypothetical protein
MPRLELIAQHMALFEDPQMKELLITPKGIRLVRQIWQAQRTEYLVLRQAKFSGVHIEAAIVECLMNAAIEISASLGGAAARAA